MLSEHVTKSRPSARKGNVEPDQAKIVRQQTCNAQEELALFNRNDIFGPLANSFVIIRQNRTVSCKNGAEGYIHKKLGNAKAVFVEDELF